MNLKLVLPPRWARLSPEPVTKLSMAMTLWPRASRRSQRWEPKKPAPPVTTEVGWFFGGVFLFLAGINKNGRSGVQHVAKPPCGLMPGWENHLAPDPLRTIGIAPHKIFRWSHSDQLSIYSRSSRTQSLKSETSLRP